MEESKIIHLEKSDFILIRRGLSELLSKNIESETKENIKNLKNRIILKNGKNSYWRVCKK